MSSIFASSISSVYGIVYSALLQLFDLSRLPLHVAMKVIQNYVQALKLIANGFKCEELVNFSFHIPFLHYL